MPTITKTCPKCSFVKELSEFGRSYYEENYVSKVCKKCVNANQKRLRDIKAKKEEYRQKVLRDKIMGSDIQNPFR